MKQKVCLSVSDACVSLRLFQAGEGGQPSPKVPGGSNSTRLSLPCETLAWPTSACSIGFQSREVLRSLTPEDIWQYLEAVLFVTTRGAAAPGAEPRRAAEHAAMPRTGPTWTAGPRAGEHGQASQLAQFCSLHVWSLRKGSFFKHQSRVWQTWRWLHGAPLQGNWPGAATPVRAHTGTPARKGHPASGRLHTASPGRPHPLPTGTCLCPWPSALRISSSNIRCW